MADRFRTWALEVIPAIIAGANGQRWQQAIGVLADALAEGARQAARSRWISTCPDDALGLHGGAMGWPQAPGESADEYRARLALNWHLQEWRGTAKGIQDAFAALGMPNVDVWDTFNSPMVRAEGTVPHRYHWFWVIVRDPHPFGTDFSCRMGDGTLIGAAPTGSGKLIGVNGDPRLVETLRGIVAAMKPAHAWCEWIAICLSGDIVTGVGSGDAEDGAPTPGSRIAYLPVT